MNQVSTIDELSAMSQHLKSNNHLLEGLRKFSSMSIEPNQNICKMIEYQQNPKNKPTVISYRNNQQLEQQKSSNHLSFPQKERKKYELQRKIPVKQDLGFFGNLMKCLLFGFIIIFCIDFYYEIQNQIEFRTKQVSQCYQDYHENNCTSPLDALVQQCKRLEFCASRDPKSVLKLSNVFIKTVIGLIGIVTKHLQIAGMIFVVVLLLVYFNRPTMYQEEKVSKYQ